MKAIVYVKALWNYIFCHSCFIEQNSNKSDISIFFITVLLKNERQATMIE